MASILSISGLMFDRDDNQSVIIQAINNDTLDQETRLMAVIVALEYGTIGFSKAEEVLREIAIFSSFNKIFERFLQMIQGKD